MADQTATDGTDEKQGYTVDVFTEEQHSVRVTATSKEEAEELAAQKVENEQRPDKILSSRAL